MKSLDTRWKQRFKNFSKAFALLDQAVKESKKRPLNELEKQGLVQRFEFTHELAWNVLKDYLEFQGFTQITGSRDASRESFNRGLIRDGEGWMEMLRSRNQSSHTYNEEIAEEIVDKIIHQYHTLFVDFLNKMDSLQT